MHVDDVAHFDLYSCFPSSLHFAADALGIAPTDARGLTVTGGLAYHGGPASGYLTHSIAAMVERLRADDGALGLVSGVGMHMTKHAFGVYSTRAGRRSSPPAAVPPPATVVPVVAAHDGDATVAAYSVVHERDGAPGRALLVCDLARRLAHLRGDRRRRPRAAGSRGRRARRDDGSAAAAEVDGALGPPRSTGPWPIDPASIEPRSPSMIDKARSHP